MTGHHVLRWGAFLSVLATPPMDGVGKGCARPSTPGGPWTG